MRAGPAPPRDSMEGSFNSSSSSSSSSSSDFYHGAAAYHSRNDAQQQLSHNYMMEMHRQHEQQRFHHHHHQQQQQQQQQQQPPPHEQQPQRYYHQGQHYDPRTGLTWPAYSQHVQREMGSFYPRNAALPPVSSPYSTPVTNFDPNEMAHGTTRRVASQQRVSWSDGAQPMMHSSSSAVVRRRAADDANVVLRDAGDQEEAHGSADADLLLGFFKEASLATAAASTDADRSNDDALVQARKSKGRTWSDVDMVDSSQNGGGGGDGGDNEAYQRKRRNSEGNQNDYAAASMSAIVTG
jgi:hypothetical protein